MSYKYENIIADEYLEQKWTSEMEEVLGNDKFRKLSWYSLFQNWKAFCTEPKKWKQTIAVDLINHYIESEVNENGYV